MAKTIGNWDEMKLAKRRLANHPIISEHSEQRISLISRHISTGANLLELGSGDGYFSIHLESRYNLLATDQSPQMLSKNPVGRKQLLNACSLPFDDNSFDVVFEANMLHHEQDDDAVLKEMVRVSKDYIVILEPNALNPFTILVGLLRPEERKSLRFTRHYVCSKMMKYPVEEVSIFSCGFYPPYTVPNWGWKLAKFLERRISWPGLENIFIFRKRHGS